MDRCIAWGKAHGPPERPNQTIWEVFEEERPKLIPYRGRFDGFHALALNRGSQQAERRPGSLPLRRSADIGKGLVDCGPFDQIAQVVQRRSPSVLMAEKRTLPVQSDVVTSQASSPYRLTESRKRLASKQNNHPHTGLIISQAPRSPERSIESQKTTIRAQIS